MSNEATFSIKPLCTGWVTLDKSKFVWGTGYGEKVDAPVIMWYLESQETRVMVDTGASDPEWAARYHYAMRRAPEEDPVRALGRIGVSPDDIDVVILTHLHWDHCYNNHLFQRARFFVQREELRYAIAPHPIHAKAYEAPTIGMTPPYINTKFEVLDGDARIADGLSVVFTPGHTPGMQGVSVSTSAGLYFIAGDSVALYENWKGNQFMKHIPGIDFVNLDDYFETLDLIEGIADFVLPGHDAKVLEKESYP
jgi:N-acyl homoserine lactone hydrolase